MSTRNDRVLSRVGLTTAPPRPEEAVLRVIRIYGAPDHLTGARPR